MVPASLVFAHGSIARPWRIEYILAPKPELPESLFTRIAQSSDDIANHVIARDRTVMLCSIRTL